MSDSINQSRPRKPAHKRCIRISVTLSPDLYDAGQQVINKYKFGGYSEYLQSRIRKDAGLELAA